MKTVNRIRPDMKQVFLFGVLLACSFLLLGWADDLKSLKEKVESVNSIKAEFTQQRHLEMLDDPLVSEGLLYFETPHSLRWEYSEPVRNVLLMKDENIRQYTQGNDGMVEQQGLDLEAMRVFLQEICMWMQGEFEANPDLEAEMKSGRRVLLKPAGDNAMAQVLQRIELKLTDKPGVIDSVKIYEDPDSYTNIKFHDIKINQGIKRGIFQELNP